MTGSSPDEIWGGGGGGGEIPRCTACHLVFIFCQSTRLIFWFGDIFFQNNKMFDKANGVPSIVTTSFTSVAHEFSNGTNTQSIDIQLQIDGTDSITSEMTGGKNDHKNSMVSWFYSLFLHSSLYCT